MSERRVQGFEQFVAEPRSGRDRKVGIVRDIRDAVEVRDLAVEHLAHEEVLREPDPAERFEGLHGGGLAHGSLPRGRQQPSLHGHRFRPIMNEGGREIRIRSSRIVTIFAISSA